MSLKLTEEIAGLVNGSLMGGNPMLLASVDAGGRPRLSFRGSIQVYSDDQLGLWARNAEGSTITAVKSNPHVALMLRAPAGPTILQFQGRARVASDPAERDRVFESAPEVERKADPERKGVGLIIDLDAVEGLLGLDAEGKRRFVRLTRD
ncbi:MAG: pyridoxamine 5'-phosphate oxidase family protein [Caulobacterales bacterium]